MIRDELAPRIYFEEKVKIRAKELSIECMGRAHNLSTKGIFIKDVEMLPLETMVDLSFALPSGKKVSIGSKVVRHVELTHVEPAGIGFEFCEFEKGVLEELNDFIDQRLQPAKGEAVHLAIGDIPAPIAARASGSYGDILSVDAELPFLRIGNSVTVNAAEPMSGSIRWVSVHMCPQTGIPRLNIGIDTKSERAELEHDDEDDPVFTHDFVEHVENLDQAIRKEKKAASA